MTARPGTAPASDTAQRFRSLRLPYKVLIVGVAAAIAFELATSLISGIVGTPGGGVVGSASSSATSPDGTAAFAQLLASRHIPVEQLTTGSEVGRLTARDTLFVLDPVGFGAADAAADVRFARAGGDLVFAGQPEADLLAELFPADRRPVWSPAPAGPDARAVTAKAFTAGVSSIDAGSGGSYTIPAPAGPAVQALVSGQGGVLALTARVGAGDVVLLATSAPLQNAGLALEDDAGFALDLAGTSTGAGRRVEFDELHHGLGTAGTGIAGLPAHWRVALLLLLAASVVWLVSAGRRLGPPQEAERDVIPPRIAHIDAVASLLAAGSNKRILAAAAPLREVANRRLHARLRLEATATVEDVREAASGTALPPGVVGPILDEPAGQDQLVELGRAVAALAGGQEGRPAGQNGR